MKQEEMSMGTKQALAGALKRAMGKKPFHKITVTELIQDCGVNRETFYYHFEDIYALLKWMLEDGSIQVVKHFDLLTDYREAIAFVMDYVEENDRILNCAYDPIGREELWRLFSADFLEICGSMIGQAEQRRGTALEPGYREFLCRFYSNAIAGVLTEWIRQRGKGDRAAVMGYLTAAIQSSLAGIFGEAYQENA